MQGATGRRSKVCSFPLKSKAPTDQTHNTVLTQSSKITEVRSHLKIPKIKPMCQIKGETERITEQGNMLNIMYNVRNNTKYKASGSGHAYNSRV